MGNEDAYGTARAADCRGSHAASISERHAACDMESRDNIMSHDVFPKPAFPSHTDTLEFRCESEAARDAIALDLEARGFQVQRSGKGKSWKGVVTVDVGQLFEALIGQLEKWNGLRRYDSFGRLLEATEPDYKWYWVRKDDLDGLRRV